MRIHMHQENMNVTSVTRLGHLVTSSDIICDLDQADCKVALSRCLTTNKNVYICFVQVLYQHVQDYIHMCLGSGILSHLIKHQTSARLHMCKRVE